MSICSYPGCNTLILEPGRCEKHRIDEDVRERERERSAYRRRVDPDQAFYTSSEWRRAAKVQLNKEPLCRKHAELGFVVEAREVDHIIPIKRGGDRFHPSNLQSLCSRCHTQKTNRERFERRTA